MKSQFALISIVISLSSHISGAQTQVTWHNGAALPEHMAPTRIRETALGWNTQHMQGGPRFRHILIQFSEPLSAERQDALAVNGVNVLQPVGANAFFAMIDAGQIDAADLAQNHQIAGLHDLHRNWKLHPNLIAGDVPPWAVVSRRADGQTPDRVAAYVLLHQDVDPANQKPALVNRHNLVIRSEVNAINCLVVELPAERLAALADEDSVSWVEPPLPALGPTNDSNRARTQADFVQANRTTSTDRA